MTAGSSSPARPSPTAVQALSSYPGEIAQGVLGLSQLFHGRGCGEALMVDGEGIPEGEKGMSWLRQGLLLGGQQPDSDFCQAA